MIKFPDYENSILSVTSSILAYFGAEHGHSTLAALDEKLSRCPKNVVLMLFDGMGAASLQAALPESSFLRSHMARQISSVFPPTTVAATTSVQSGLSPAEHGRLGWYLYFPEVDDNVTVFGNILQKTGKRAEGTGLAEQVLPYEDICSQITKASGVRAETISPFSDHPCHTLASLFKTAGQILSEKERHFLYCYWPQPDKDMHIYGVQSLKAKRDIRRIDRCAARFCEKLQDTLVIIIADHGLVDTKWLDIYDYPELAFLLEKKPSIERRAAALYVKDGMQEKFEQEFRKTFSDRFLLLNKNEIRERRLFGEGREHERFESFLGDYLAVSTGEWSLAGLKGDTLMKGCHAGATEQEMMVPLILIET